MEKPIKHTSLQRFVLFKQVDRRAVWQNVSKTLRKENKRIAIRHIASVVSILFDEIINEIYSKEILEIGNFGKFFYKSTKPRRHFDIWQQKVITSKGNKLLRFKLYPKITKFLVKRLDVDKTLGESKDGKKGS